MITIPQVQQLIDDAVKSDDAQVRATGAVAATLFLIYTQIQGRPR
jgi:hypothetical protein